jgi:phage tail-like protein
MRSDPYRSFNFKVLAGEKELGAFSDVTGLTADGDTADYRAGNDIPQRVRKLPGLRKYTPVTLKRGYTQNLDLWKWYTNIANGVADRRDITIVLLDEARNEVLEFSLESAFVNKIEGPSFKAGGNEIAIESLEFVHEGLTMELAK